ncbi:MAG: hypothetical protein U1E64_03855 [Sphingomonadaceae bacterium]
MNRSIPAVIALALSTAAQAQEVHSPQDGAASAEITCQAGVYLLEKGGSSSAGYVSIAESLMQHRKVTGMIGFALTGGLAGMKIKSVLPGALAKVRTIQKRPEFRFCFERPAASDDSAQSGSTYVGQSKAAFSPGDFRLVRFEKAKDQRELAVSKSHFGGMSGALSDSSIRFVIVEESPGVFRVTPNEDLTPGEYGFFHGVGNGYPNPRERNPVERVFDFAVES